MTSSRLASGPFSLGLRRNAHGWLGDKTTIVPPVVV
jgi:hypothetical protein